MFGQSDDALGRLSMRRLSEEELDERIDAWHNGDGDDLELHEYLGVSWQDYAAWVECRASLLIYTGD